MASACAINSISPSRLSTRNPSLSVSVQRMRERLPANREVENTELLDASLASIGVRCHETGQRALDTPVLAVASGGFAPRQALNRLRMAGRAGFGSRLLPFFVPLFASWLNPPARSNEQALFHSLSGLSGSSFRLRPLVCSGLTFSIHCSSSSAL